MSNNIDKLKKKVKDSNAAKERLQSEISALEATIQQKANSAQQAAEEGNTQSFRAFKAEKEDAEAELYVKRAQLNKLPIVSEDETLEAWETYAEQASHILAKKMVEYRSKCRDLADCIRTLSAKIKESYEVREFCARSCGSLNNNHLHDSGILKVKYPLEISGINSLSNDVDFFENIGMLTHDEATGIRILIYGQTSKQW